MAYIPICLLTLIGGENIHDEPYIKNETVNAPLSNNIARSYTAAKMSFGEEQPAGHTGQ
jgi:hypothetical protein